MTKDRSWKPFAAAFYFTLMGFLALYFVASAVQGDLGIFRRVQIEAENKALQTELAALTASRDHLKVKTRRLSDTYLDLDLLDERARAVLGYGRPDEILIR